MTSMSTRNINSDPMAYPDLPEIGSPGFTALLLRYVLAHPSLEEWELDPTLFSVLVLALVVKKGGIIVDLPRYGIEKMGRVISAMTKSVFGLATHHLTLDSKTIVKDIIPKLSHTPFTPSYASTSTATPASASRSATPQGLRGAGVAESSRGQARNEGDHRQSGRELSGPDVLVVTGLEDMSSPVQIKLCDVLTRKRFEVRINEGNRSSVDNGTTHSVSGSGQVQAQKGARGYANGAAPERNDASSEQKEGGSTFEERSFEPLVIWLREEGSEAPSWVIDHFMCSISVDPDDVESPPSDLDDQALIPSSYLSTLRTLLPYVHVHPPLSIHISNLLSAVSSHPGLKTCFTQRAVRAFPEYVQAHRLLSGSFELPSDFASRVLNQSLDPNEIGIGRGNNLVAGTGTQERHGNESAGDKRLGGGIGGVDSWALRAGEIPTLSSLCDAEHGEVVEDPYATPVNVEGVWRTFVAHRCKKRAEREEVMWLMKGSAGQGLDVSDGGGNPGDGRGKDEVLKKRKKRSRKGVDSILDDILRTV